MESIFEMIPVICISDDSAFHNVQLSITACIVYKLDYAVHPGRHFPVRVAHLHKLHGASLRIVLPELLQNLGPDAHSEQADRFLSLGVEPCSLCCRKQSR